MDIRVPTGKSIKTKSIIHIVDNDVDVRNSLRWLCESANYTVETYSSAADFLERYDPSFTGCLLVDEQMPRMNGLELIEIINLNTHYLSIIVISGYADVSVAVKAMKLGAVDFILKPFNSSGLLNVIQHCIENPKISAYSIELVERFNQLSKREQQVLELILQGKLNKQMCSELDIAISTVEAHRANIMKKMKVRTLAELIRNCLHLKQISNNRCLVESESLMIKKVDEVYEFRREA